MSAAVVLLAAGSGTRVGPGVDKILDPVAGVPVLAWSLRTVLALDPATTPVGVVVVVVRAGQEEAVQAAVAPYVGERRVLMVVGGASRHASEWVALRTLAPSVLSGEVDVVAIHDGARPLASAELFAATITAAREHGGAIPVAPVPGLVSRADLTVVRHAAVVQTPQAFAALDLLDAYQQAALDGFEGTDTAACLERYARVRVVAVPSGPRNLKITFPEDLALAADLSGLTSPGQPTAALPGQRLEDG